MLAEMYINRHAKPKKKTWKIDESCLNQLFIPKFGAHLASAITRADVASIHADIGPLRCQSLCLDCAQDV
jgi:hypothetical protein